MRKMILISMTQNLLTKDSYAGIINPYLTPQGPEAHHAKARTPRRRRTKMKTARTSAILNRNNTNVSCITLNTVNTHYQS